MMSNVDGAPNPSNYDRDLSLIGLKADLEVLVNKLKLTPDEFLGAMAFQFMAESAKGREAVFMEDAAEGYEIRADKIGISWRMKEGDDREISGSWEDLKQAFADAA